LYPDRLAEDYLALMSPAAQGDGGQAGDLADPWAADMPADLLAPASMRAAVPTWAGTGMTVLIQAAVRWLHVRTGYLYPLLREHPVLATVASGATLATLLEFDDLAPQVIDAIESLLPEGRDFHLDLVMAALTRRVAERRLAAATGPAEEASLRVRFGNRYSFAGLHELALAEYQRAADAYRALADGDPEEHRASLADALNRLAREHAFLEHPLKLALALTEEAAGLLRLADPDAEWYLKRLIPVLLSLGDRLSPVPLGRQEDALAIREEAVALARQYAARTGAARGIAAGPDGACTTGAGEPARSGDQEDSLWSLATALSGLSVSLRVAERTADAAHAAREGVAVGRRLVEADRNRYLALLAWTLRTLAQALLADGQAPASLTAAGESLDLYRLLVRANPNAYLEALAQTLADYGSALRGNGQPAQALDAATESLAIRRDLARADPALHGIVYAAALCDYSGSLASAGRGEEATAAAREALALVKSLPGVEPLHIAMATGTLAERLTSRDTAAEGRTLSKTAITLYRELGAESETALLAGLLGELALQELALGNVAEARAAAEEAVSLMRPLAAGGRDRDGRTLAWALHRYATILDGSPETKDAAVLTMREAVDAHRAVLSPEDPLDLTRLAYRQQQLVGMLTLAGRDAEALPLTGEVVEGAYAGVAAEPGQRHLHLLCWALHDFAWTRWTTRQELPEAAEGAGKLALLLRHAPDDGSLVFPDLPTTLRVRAMILTELGQQEEARSLHLAARDAEAAEQHSKDLAPGRPALRRIYTMSDLADPSVPHGAEALAVAAVTADPGTWERNGARSMLRRRRWLERHPRIARLLFWEPAENGGPDAASLLADVLAFDANDRRESKRTRLDSARKLARLGDPRGVQYLIAQAGDRDFPRRRREEAAQAVAKANDPRGQVLLADIQAETAGAPDAGEHGWSLAVTTETVPTLRGASPAALRDLRQRQPSPGAPASAAEGAEAAARGFTGPGALTRWAAVLGLLVPAGLSVFLGDAIAQAPGTHPGLGNWVALGITGCLVLWFVLVELISHAFKYAARAFRLNPDARNTSGGCYVFLMPLLIAAGYLLAGTPALEFLRPAGAFVWHILIWR